MLEKQLEQLNQLIDDLTAEFSHQFTLPVDKIREAVTEAAYQETQVQRAVEPEEVEVKDGDKIPEHDLEILKSLIRKAALRKLKRLESEEKKKVKSKT